MSDKKYLLFAGQNEGCGGARDLKTSGSLQHCIDEFKRLQDSSGALKEHDPFDWAHIVDADDIRRIVLETSVNYDGTYLWIDPGQVAREKARTEALSAEFYEKLGTIYPELKSSIAAAHLCADYVNLHLDDKSAANE